jgi:hypothetical protein
MSASEAPFGHQRSMSIFGNRRPRRPVRIRGEHLVSCAATLSDRYGVA